LVVIGVSGTSDASSSRLLREELRVSRTYILSDCFLGVSMRTTGVSRRLGRLGNSSYSVLRFLVGVSMTTTGTNLRVGSSSE
jgi:hypothetical protein